MGWCAIGKREVVGLREAISRYLEGVLPGVYLLHIVGEREISGSVGKLVQLRKPSKRNRIG